MINNRFKGYTYTEYQNEMCDKAIESNENALELYKRARDGKPISSTGFMGLPSYAPQLIGISELNRRIERTEKAIEHLREVRNSNGLIIEPLYKSYWDNVYSR
jgi:tetratricopeptide (TPR) repeat protein